MPSRSAGPRSAVGIGLLLMLGADLARSARLTLRPLLFARYDSTNLTNPACPNPDFKQCGNGLPDNFCCISGANCMALAGNTTALCCISKTCDKIPPVSCDLSLQNVAYHPNADLMTTFRTMSLPTCGGQCCPFGYSCGSRKNNALYVPSCNLDVDQSQVPNETSIAAASGLSLGSDLSTTRMASTPVIIGIVLAVVAIAAIVVGLIFWRRKSRRDPALYPSGGLLARWKNKLLIKGELPIDMDEHELQSIDFIKNGRPISAVSSTATAFSLTAAISPSIESKPRGGIEDRNANHSDDSEAESEIGAADPAHVREGSGDVSGGSRPARAHQYRKLQSRTLEHHDSPTMSRSPPAHADVASSASRGLKHPPLSNGGGAADSTVQAANPHRPLPSPLDFNLALPASRRLSAVPASLNVLKKALASASDQALDAEEPAVTAPPPATLPRPASTLLPVRYQPDSPPERSKSATTPSTESKVSLGDKNASSTVKQAAQELRKASTETHNAPVKVKQPTAGIKKPSLVVNDKFSPTVGVPSKVLDRPFSPLDDRAPTLPSVALPSPMPRGPPGRLNIPAIFQNTSQAMPEFGSIPIQAPDLSPTMPGMRLAGHYESPDDVGLPTGMRTSLSQFNFSLDVVDAPPLPRGPLPASTSKPTLPSISLPPALPPVTPLSAATGPLSLGRLSFDVPLTLDAPLARVLQKKDAGAAAP